MVVLPPGRPGRCRHRHSGDPPLGRKRGPTRVLVDGQALGTIRPSPDCEGAEISKVFPLDTDRPAGPVKVRFEVAGPATTIRLREVRLVR